MRFIMNKKSSSRIAMRVFLRYVGVANMGMLLLLEDGDVGNGSIMDAGDDICLAEPCCMGEAEQRCGAGSAETPDFMRTVTGSAMPNGTIAFLRGGVETPSMRGCTVSILYQIPHRKSFLRTRTPLATPPMPSAWLILSSARKSRDARSLTPKKPDGGFWKS